MDGNMRAAVMNGVGSMGYVERPIPAPRDDEALIRLEYVGVCGSDLHYYESGAIGSFVVKPPFVLGHEAAGVVAEIGKGVKGLRPGDRVALEPGKPCGRCQQCREGRYNLCPDVVFFATPPVDGVFSEYVAHDASLCFKLPDGVGALEGALIEPLAVGLHAARQGGAQAGMSAAVFGAGCIGLVSMMALRALGVTRTHVIDMMQKRLDKAKELGATSVINCGEEDPVKAIARLDDGNGCDLVIEASGSEVAASQAVSVAKPGSTIVMVGYSKSGMVNMPMAVAINKELTIKTVFRYRHIYPMAIETVSSGRVNLKGLVTDVFGFDDMQNAMDSCVADKAGIVKAVIKF